MTEIFDVSTGDSAHTIVFLHAAVGDRRMWRPQWGRLGDTHRLVRIDLRGFGSRFRGPEPFSHASDVVNVLDQVGVESAMLVGASMGGRVATELAIGHPDRVNALMLIGAVLPGHTWSQQVQDFWAVEAKALDAGGVNQAVAANLEFWIDGPNRDRARLSASDRNLVEEMQARAFEIELAEPDPGPAIHLPDMQDRLAEISVPTAVLYGTEDAADIAVIADSLATSIPQANLHEIANTAHLPSMEEPERCTDLLLELVG